LGGIIGTPFLVIEETGFLFRSPKYSESEQLRLKPPLPGKGLGRNHTGDEPPLRAELFSADQMEQHGKNLAGSHKLSPGRAPDLLLARLAENEDVLLGVRNLLTEAVKANRRITPAGEWLLDNFYLIEEHRQKASA
jgi:cyclic beta-1,2-glucan synthetase